jgi:hypothetical protein
MSKDVERAAVKAARQKLEKQIGVSVGSGYGFPESLNEDPQYFLIVWSDVEVEFPETFEGYRVVRRGVPVAL